MCRTHRVAHTAATPTTTAATAAMATAATTATVLSNGSRPVLCSAQFAQIRNKRKTRQWQQQISTEQFIQVAKHKKKNRKKQNQQQMLPAKWIIASLTFLFPAMSYCILCFSLDFRCLLVLFVCLLLCAFSHTHARAYSTHTTLKQTHIQRHTHTKDGALGAQVFGCRCGQTSVTRETARWGARARARWRRRRKRRAKQRESSGLAGWAEESVSKWSAEPFHFDSFWITPPPPPPLPAATAAACVCTSASDCYFSLTLQQQQHTITFVRPRANFQLCSRVLLLPAGKAAKGSGPGSGRGVVVPPLLVLLLLLLLLLFAWGGGVGGWILCQQASLNSTHGPSFTHARTHTQARAQIKEI